MNAFGSLVEWLASRIDELGVPGAAIGVVHGGQRLVHGIGVANVETGTLFTPDTPFAIASLSKIFTATVIATLANEGDLHLDDPVAAHLPDFRLADEAATKAATIGHLVSHTGGWTDILEPEPGQDSFPEYASRMADLPQLFHPGAHFSYSNSGFMLAGGAIEEVTGRPFEDVLSEMVFRPLGMHRTGFITDQGPAPDRACGHQVVDDAMVVIPSPEISRVVSPAAGLVSTLEDMLTFVQAHAAIDRGRLDPDALATMRRPRITGGSLGPVIVDRIGTGWMLLHIDGETVLMSQGGDSGMISAMVAVPSRGFGMVAFANADAGMMLANDAVLRGLSTFTSLTLPEPGRHTLIPDEAAAAEGHFGFPEWMEFTVTPAGGSTGLAVSAGGEEIAGLSGQYTMTSATRGYKPYLGGRLWLDLVPDTRGHITWIRFAARIVPRQE